MEHILSSIVLFDQRHYFIHVLSTDKERKKSLHNVLIYYTNTALPVWYKSDWIVATQIKFNQQMRRQIHIEQRKHLFDQIELILNYYLADFVIYFFS